MNKYIHLVGRILIAIIFIGAGVGKLADPAANIGYMQAMGVPAALLYPSAIFEIVAGLCLVIGFKTRWAAFALAGFCVLTAVIFHSKGGDQIQMIMFLKNLAIAGGLLLLASSGTTALAIDKK